MSREATRAVRHGRGHSLGRTLDSIEAKPLPPAPADMTPVPRIGRVLDLVGLVSFLIGGGFIARAWIGFREVQGYVPPPDAKAMTAVEFADQFWRMQRVGVGLMLIGIAVFVAAWWIARRAHNRAGPPDPEDKIESAEGGT